MHILLNIICTQSADNLILSSFVGFKLHLLSHGRPIEPNVKVNRSSKKEYSKTSLLVASRLSRHNLFQARIDEIPTFLCTNEYTIAAFHIRAFQNRFTLTRLSNSFVYELIIFQDVSACRLSSLCRILFWPTLPKWKSKVFTAFFVSLISLMKVISTT